MKPLALITALIELASCGCTWATSSDQRSLQALCRLTRSSRGHGNGLQMGEHPVKLLPLAILDHIECSAFTRADAGGSSVLEVRQT